ncbi:MAG: sulfatase-like hydrolase/transferase [Planctomycetota bacterium]
MGTTGIAIADDRPNVLLITVDDLDRLETGVTSDNFYTPALSALAAQGVTFTQGHVTSTVCTPSRYTLLTGRYASRSTHEFFLARYPQGTMAGPDFAVTLEEDRPNLARTLQAKGYRTGFVGKWHLSDHRMVRSPRLWPSFDMATYARDADPRNPDVDAAVKANHRWWATRIQAFGFDTADAIYVANPRELYNESLYHHNQEWVTSAALDFLQDSDAGDKKRRPFFLSVNFTVPHGPSPKAKQGGKYIFALDAPLDLGSAGVIERDLTSIQGPRGSLIERVRERGLPDDAFFALWFDDSIASLLAELERQDERGNTLVVFISDHGNSTTRSKASLYEPGTNVPFIVCWPDGTNKLGRTNGSLVANLDIVPTILDAARVPLTSGMAVDGRSLLPILEDKAESVRDTLLLELGYARAVKHESWKYIAVRYPEDVEAQIQAGERFPLHQSVVRRRGLIGDDAVLDRPLWFSHQQLAYEASREWPNYFESDQLYDLKADPGETVNLADSEPEALAQMKAILTQELLAFPNRPFGEFAE